MSDRQPIDKKEISSEHADFVAWRVSQAKLKAQHVEVDKLLALRPRLRRETQH
jgi:hypothetical protein